MGRGVKECLINLQQSKINRDAPQVIAAGLRIIIAGVMRFTPADISIG